MSITPVTARTTNTEPNNNPNVFDHAIQKLKKKSYSNENDQKAQAAMIKFLEAWKVFQQNSPKNPSS